MLVIQNSFSEPSPAPSTVELVLDAFDPVVEAPESIPELEDAKNAPISPASVPTEV